MKKITINTPDGTADCHAFHPDGDGAWPAVLFYMDGVGMRPQLDEMARRLARSGYYVLLPNLYYRAGSHPPFDPATAFVPGPERDRLMPLLRSVNAEFIMRDTAAFLAFLSQQPAVAGDAIGCVGYCLGGKFALAAAAVYPDRVAAAASIHGGALATDQPDSPHLLAGKIRGSVYAGIAGIDPGFTDQERQRLESALESAGVRHAVEVYPGVRHGFAVTGMPAYDRAASELHWERLLGLFGQTLPRK